MAYGYVSVSETEIADSTSLKDQIQQIQQQYPNANIQSEVYQDSKERPLLEQVIKQCSKGDSLIVTSIDRLGLTMGQVLDDIYAVKRQGAKSHVLDMGIVDDSPVGTAIMACLSAFRQYEKTQLTELTQAGKSIARDVFFPDEIWEDVRNFRMMIFWL